MQKPSSHVNSFAEHKLDTLYWGQPQLLIIGYVRLCLRDPWGEGYYTGCPRKNVPK